VPFPLFAAFCHFSPPPSPDIYPEGGLRKKERWRLFCFPPPFTGNHFFFPGTFDERIFLHAFSDASFLAAATGQPLSHLNEPLSKVPFTANYQQFPPPPPKQGQPFFWNFLPKPPGFSFYVKVLWRHTNLRSFPGNLLPSLFSARARLLSFAFFIFGVTKSLLFPLMRVFDTVAFFSFSEFIWLSFFRYDSPLFCSEILFFFFSSSRRSFKSPPLGTFSGGTSSFFPDLATIFPFPFLLNSFPSCREYPPI